MSSAEIKVFREQITPNVSLVTEKINKFYSFSLGIFIDYGSRDENSVNNGITHLIEHMLFKGTTNKTSLDIVKFIEGLGGSFDAYTTKENLIIITKFLSEHLGQVFNLISELLIESKIAEEELVKEKSVIQEEIKTSNEDPSDYIFDLMFKNLFPDDTIGLPIAGTQESLNNITTEKTRQHYRNLLQRNIVIALSGNFDDHEIRQAVEEKFKLSSPIPLQRTTPKTSYGRIATQKRKEISQVHCVFAAPGVAFSSPKRYISSVLNTALGGGMSSRLFQGLREQHGLVYNVQSFIDLYSDCGITGFYFTCDKKNLGKVAEQVKLIFNDIAQQGFNQEEIELAKTYLSGNLMLSLESSTNRMLRFGREMSILKQITPIDLVIENIRKVNKQDVNELIEQYHSASNYTIAAIGPVTEEEIGSTFQF